MPRTRCGAPPRSSAGYSKPIATTGIRCWLWWMKHSFSHRRLPGRSRTRHASSLGAMTNLMCRGRKRGLAGVIATQRLAKLAKNVAAEASNFLMGRTFLDIDMARAADLLGMERRQADFVSRPGAWTVHGAGPSALSPPPGTAHRSNGHPAAQCDSATHAAAGSGAGGRTRCHPGSATARGQPAPTPIAARPFWPAHGGKDCSRDPSRRGQAAT